VWVFRFPSDTKEFKKWEVSIYQILICQKINDLYVIAIVNKNLVNRTVSFENELVPLNGRIIIIEVMETVVWMHCRHC